MNGRPTHESYVTEIESHRTHALTKLARGASLLPALNALADEWGPADAYGERYATVCFPTEYLAHGKLCLDIHLGKNDRIAHAMPLVRKVRALPGVARVLDGEGKPRFSDSEDMHTRTYDFTFQPADSEKPLELMVRVWTSSSTRCTFVPSGETRPVMKLVCDDDDNAEAV